MPWQNIFQHPQLIVIIIALGISGINWVLRQAKAQSEQRRVQDLRNRQAAEALRTGQPLPPPTPAPTLTPKPAPLRPAPSLAEAAKLRQAAQQSLEQERRERLRQLRAQADARGTSPSSPPLVSAPSPFEAAPRPTAPAARAAPIRRELWPGGPVVLINPPAAKPTARAAPQPPAQRKASAKPARPQPQQRRDAVSPTSRAPRMAVQQTITSSMPVLAAPAPQADLSRAPRMAPPRPQPRPQPAAPALAITPADWRRALIASEILAHPLALRDPATLAGAPHY